MVSPAPTAPLSAALSTLSTLCSRTPCLVGRCPRTIIPTPSPIRPSARRWLARLLTSPQHMGAPAPMLAAWMLERSRYMWQRNHPWTPLLAPLIPSRPPRPGWPSASPSSRDLWVLLWVPRSHRPSQQAPITRTTAPTLEPGHRRSQRTRCLSGCSSDERRCHRRHIRSDSNVAPSCPRLLSATLLLPVSSRTLCSQGEPSIPNGGR